MSSGFARNKCADQPAHPRRLISAFVIHFLKSIISKLATIEIAFFLLVSVAEETGLNPRIPIGFCSVMAHIFMW